MKNALTIGEGEIKIVHSKKIMKATVQQNSGKYHWRNYPTKEDEKRSIQFLQHGFNSDWLNVCYILSIVLGAGKFSALMDWGKQKINL